MTNPSSTMPDTAAPASPQPEQHKMPVFSTAGAMSLMWHKAVGKMDPQELEWIAGGAAEQAGCEARALAATLEGVACLVSSDESSGAFQDADSVSTLLFGLSNQVSTIAGLAEIAADANYRVRLALKGGAK
jgi:hypothetical protein